MPEPTTIRLTDEEKALAQAKADAYGVRTLAAIIRMALRRLPMPKRDLSSPAK